MKMKQLIRHSALFVVAFAAFGLSVISAINLTDYPIHNGLAAIWVFVQLAVTLAGLLTLPVFMLSLFLRIIGLVQQPAVKRKNAASDTIAS
jgi:hypothetical protein